MRNPTAIIQRCTAQRRNGEFCDLPTYPDMPFPICRKHAEKVHARWTEHNGNAAKNTAEWFAEAMRERFQATGHSDEYQERMERRQEALKAQSQVYYVKIGDHVKIGVTTNLRARLVGLRVDAEYVLATEPGDAALEAERHRQFAAERVGRRENFNPSRRLIAHIQELRDTYGPPKITGYPKVA